MTSLQPHASEPTEHLGHDGERLCPECIHEPSEPRFRLSVWVAQRLGMRPPRAYCTEWQTSLESGLGLPGECNCRNSFHGS